MKHTIANDHLSVSAHDKGAELSNIIDLSSGKEYMWQANDPEYWGRHSSILFPVIGACNNGEIIVDGRSYPMPKHGIVRNAEFRLAKKTSDYMEFELQSTTETHIHYPFEWTLKVGYQLTGVSLEVRYEVVNEGREELPYSIGGHPAFNCPLDEGLQRSDYHLVFDKEEFQQSPKIAPDGLISKETDLIMDHSNTIHIADDLFAEDALILTHPHSAEVSLESGSGSKLSCSIDGFSHLGIWASPGAASFVCIEPWCGIADPVGYHGDIYEKPGILVLSANAAAIHTHVISIS